MPASESSPATASLATSAEVCAVLLMGITMLMAHKPSVMGYFTRPLSLKIARWFTPGVMASVVAAMFATWIG